MWIKILVNLFIHLVYPVIMIGTLLFMYNENRITAGELIIAVILITIQVRMESKKENE